MFGIRPKNNNLNNLNDTVLREPFFTDSNAILRMNAKQYKNTWTRIKSIIGTQEPARQIFELKKELYNYRRESFSLARTWNELTDKSTHIQGVWHICSQIGSNILGPVLGRYILGPILSLPILLLEAVVKALLFAAFKLVLPVALKLTLSLTPSFIAFIIDFFYKDANLLEKFKAFETSCFDSLSKHKYLNFMNEGLWLNMFGSPAKRKAAEAAEVAEAVEAAEAAEAEARAKNTVLQHIKTAVGNTYHSIPKGKVIAAIGGLALLSYYLYNKISYVENAISIIYPLVYPNL